MVGVVDEGVAAEASLTLIGLGDAAVDDEEEPIAPDGALTLPFLDGDVAVDDVGVGGVQAEFPQNHLADGALLDLGVVGIVDLYVGLRLGDEIALKGGDLALAEEGGLGSHPKVPAQIHGALPLHGARRGVEGGPDLGVQGVQIGPPRQVFAVQRDGLEGPVRRHGDTAVVEEVAVDHLVHPAVGKEEPNVLAQQIAVLERGGEPVHQLLLLL